MIYHPISLTSKVQTNGYGEAMVMARCFDMDRRIWVYDLMYSLGDYREFQQRVPADQIAEITAPPLPNIICR